MRKQTIGHVVFSGDELQEARAARDRAVAASNRDLEAKRAVERKLDIAVAALRAIRDHGFGGPTLAAGAALAMIDEESAD